MPALLPAPGVRFHSADPPRSLPELRSDVAGFVGYAERGPLHTPMRVESWHQFESGFGGFGAGGFLPYAVHAFFENGGQTAWIVRAAVPPGDGSVPWHRQARDAYAELPLETPGGDRDPPLILVRARSPGRWGNRLSVEIAPAGTGADTRVTLVVRDRDGNVWRMPDCSLDPADGRYLPRVVETAPELPVRMDLALPDPGEAVAPLAAKKQLRGGRDGTGACGRDHLLGGETDASARWGLGALLDVDEVAIVAVPESGEFPADPAEPAPPAQPPACDDLSAPEPDVLRAVLPQRPAAWTVDEAAAYLGATPEALRQANPGLADPVPPGAPLRLPVPRSAHPADPRIDDPRPWWAPGDPASAVREGVERMAAAHGLTPAELLAANPAFRPAIAGDAAWTAPDVPVVVPEPAPEPPARWGQDRAGECARALIRFCELRRDCVALIDPPGDARTAEAVETFRAELDTTFAGLYWPWLRTELDPRRGASGAWAPTVDVPPSGWVAGLTAAADLAAGPHRSPAGQTARRALALAAPVDEAVHGRLNARGINVFRERPVRGVVLEGARSLAAGAAGEWRYLNVRRVFLTIAEAIEEGTQWAVFESNGPLLWADLRDGVRSYLRERWRRGWLMGEEAADAFYVRCDEETNTAETRDQGLVIAVVGLRLPPPIEWIVVRIGRSALGLEILDVQRA
ncbi:MAG TPA: phage tail sheath subtilisin-like domain-containing protein [Longimicrobiaceae bacterium]|jgi:phage tail sheath protein FI|nr:phage tail sheath subtilisin-like domain-containing protein [Longimicrobiaceae bacterium]